MSCLLLDHTDTSLNMCSPCQCLCPPLPQARAPGSSANRAQLTSCTSSHHCQSPSQDQREWPRGLGDLPMQRQQDILFSLVDKDLSSASALWKGVLLEMLKPGALSLKHTAHQVLKHHTTVGKLANFSCSLLHKCLKKQNQGVWQLRYSVEEMMGGHRESSTEIILDLSGDHT